MVGKDQAAEAETEGEAEKEKSMNESTFTADYLTGVFSWGNLAALPKKEKPEVLQYRACLKDGGLQDKVL